MKKLYQNVFFDLNKLQLTTNQSDNPYDLTYNYYQGNNKSLKFIECRMMTNNSLSNKPSNINSIENVDVAPTNLVVDVVDSNTPSRITSGAQGEVHMFGVSHKRNLMTQNDLKNMRHQSLNSIPLEIFTGSCNEIKDNTELPSTDASASDDFHPIFSQMLLSGQKTSKTDRLYWGEKLIQQILYIHLYVLCPVEYDGQLQRM